MDSPGSPGPCDLAPEGYYSTGTGVKISCGSGKWSAAGATLLSQCFDCPAGYVCAGTTKVDCGAGNFCAAGSSATSVCTAGYSCPDAATEIMVLCPAGTWSAASASSCSPADSGYYTAQLATSATESSCGTGFYCDGGAIGPYDES
jgi:hypothetical protein